MWMIDILLLAIGGVVGYKNDTFDFIQDYPMYVVICVALGVGLIQYLFDGYVGLALGIGLLGGYVVYRLNGGW